MKSSRELYQECLLEIQPWINLKSKLMEVAPFMITMSKTGEFSFQYPEGTQYRLDSYDKRIDEIIEKYKFKSITGHNTPGEWKAAEEAYEGCQKLMMEYIEKWDGARNSGLGDALYRKFEEMNAKKEKTVTIPISTGSQVNDKGEPWSEKEIDMFKWDLKMQQTTKKENFHYRDWAKPFIDKVIQENKYPPQAEQQVQEYLSGKPVTYPAI